MDEMPWRTGRPPEHGYYLGAWQCGERWTVSELWFNPDSIGTGWWPSRGYFHERSAGMETIAVRAWMPMPVYTAAHHEQSPGREA